MAGLISYTLYRRTNTKQGSGQSEAKDIACHVSADRTFFFFFFFFLFFYCPATKSGLGIMLNRPKF